MDTNTLHEFNIQPKFQVVSKRPVTTAMIFRRRENTEPDGIDNKFLEARLE